MTEVETAAVCKGVKVPASPFLTETRIARIAQGLYEGDEIAGALSVVRSGDRVLELGAGLGVVGAVIAVNARPEAMLSFEANPDLIPHIRALYRENGLDGMIELRNQVLVSAPERPETMTFHLHSSYLGSSLIDPPARRTRPIEVETADFRKTVAAFRPTVLIMDIEGAELDLLTHAGLDGIRAIVVEFHPSVYGKAGMQACKSILRDAGFEKADGPSTRLVWTCTRTTKADGDTGDPPLPEGGWSHEVRQVDGATVLAPQGQAKHSPSGVVAADGTDVPEASLWYGRRRVNQPFARPDAVTEHLSGRWLWGGTLWNYFPHFIVESLGRLWALDRLETPPDGIVFIPRRHDRAGPDPAGSGLRPFQAEVFAELGADLPIRVVDDRAQVERLIVPGQGFGLGEISAGTPAFRDFIHRRFGRDVAPEGGDKLYISRGLLGPNRGGLLGEAQIEAALATQGYEIFHPQKHDIRTQIARYKAARLIVAPEGSALHLYAFVGRSDQRVAMISRRSSGATANILRHLESFTGTPATELRVLREVWQPAHSRRRRLSVGEPDLVRLQAALVAAGFLDPGPAWAPLDQASLRDWLGDRYVATGEALADD